MTDYPQEALHRIEMYRLATGEYEFTCSCGYEATGYEDADQADAAADEHIHLAGDTP